MHEQNSATTSVDQERQRPEAYGLQTPPASVSATGVTGAMRTAADCTPPGSPMDVDYEYSSGGRSSPPKTRKPLISVFDWDDTLCPSSWLYRKGLLAKYGLVDAPVASTESSFERTPPPTQHQSTMNNGAGKDTQEEHRETLRQFEQQVLALLHTAHRFGPVFIVTAAKLNWVRQCAEYFLPNVLQLLTKSESLHVISAREFYHDQMKRHPPTGRAVDDSPIAWKSAAFAAVCAHLRVEDVYRRSLERNHRAVRVEFISVGDSVCERDACRALEASAPVMLQGKTIKFLERSSLAELAQQVTLTRALYDQICGFSGSLSLHIVQTRANELQFFQTDVRVPARHATPADPSRHQERNPGTTASRHDPAAAPAIHNTMTAVTTGPKTCL